MSVPLHNTDEMAVLTLPTQYPGSWAWIQKPVIAQVSLAGVKSNQYKTTTWKAFKLFSNKVAINWLIFFFKCTPSSCQMQQGEQLVLQFWSLGWKHFFIPGQNHEVKRENGNNPLTKATSKIKARRNWRVLNISEFRLKASEIWNPAPYRFTWLSLWNVSGIGCCWKDKQGCGLKRSS